MQAWDEAVAVAEANGGLSALTIDDTDPVFAARLEANAAPTDWYRLTLLAEVAAEIPRPAEDQTARMSIQVELMNDGVRSFDQAALDELVRQWCASGPQDEAVTGLRPRFFNAISAAAVK